MVVGVGGRAGVAATGSPEGSTCPQWRLVQGLLAAIGVRDRDTRSHAERAGELAAAVAAELGHGTTGCRITRLGALMHDVGKLAVPAGLLTRPSPLTSREFALVAVHPRVGAGMLVRLGFPEAAVEIVRHHHERFDGDGYTDGLAGEAIPELARVASVVDAFDAMTAGRPYRPARPTGAAVGELARCAGTQFDPRVVAALVTVVGARPLPARGTGGRSRP